MMSTPPRIGNDEPERRKQSANAEEEDGKKRKNDGGIHMGGGGEREEVTMRDSSRAPPEAQKPSGLTRDGGARTHQSTHSVAESSVSSHSNTAR